MHYLIGIFSVSRQLLESVCSGIAFWP